MATGLPLFNDGNRISRYLPSSAISYQLDAATLWRYHL
jgi:hypothetical protein